MEEICGFLKSILEKKIQDTQNYIQGKDGDTPSESKAIMDRWKQHFQEILNEEMEGENTNEQQAANEREEQEISMEELEEGINKLKTGKAPESDKITTEMIKH
ncbi:hypothetical protein Trydic_g8144 [Trypoxylus dichotomus]